MKDGQKNTLGSWCGNVHVYLVGGFNPSEKYESQWEGLSMIIPYIMENKTYLKPPTSYVWWIDKRLVHWSYCIDKSLQMICHEHDREYSLVALASSKEFRMDLRPSTHYGNTLYKSLTHPWHPFTNYKEKGAPEFHSQNQKRLPPTPLRHTSDVFVMLAIPPKEGRNTTKYIGAWNWTHDDERNNPSGKHI